MPKKPHPSEIFERAQIARATSFALYFRRGANFVIREDGITALPVAIARADAIERAHGIGSQCLIYAVTPEGRAFLVPADMRLAARTNGSQS